jgi:Zn-dependent protease with chaperone function
VDRELVLAGLMVITVSLTLLATGPWPRSVEPRISARQWERASWRGLWSPSVPVVLVISVLIGWAIVEPANSDELLPGSALVIIGVFLALWLRAVIRAIRALRSPTPLVAGTIGLWRPRIVVSDALVAQLDADALAAVKAHEAAHARHRDPLRIWLGQLLTDLEWPWPAAQHRFERWRQILELARDEEARVSGVDGADLAAAVLLVARTRHTQCSTAASLIASRSGLEERVGRLLAPLADEEPPVAITGAIALAPVCLLGVLSGIRFGDGLVQTIVKWL